MKYNCLSPRNLTILGRLLKFRCIYLADAFVQHDLQMRNILYKDYVDLDINPCLYINVQRTIFIIIRIRQNLTVLENNRCEGEFEVQNADYHHTSYKQGC